MPDHRGERGDGGCGADNLPSWWSVVRILWEGAEPGHEAVLYLGACEQPVCSRGGDEHPVKGAPGEALWWDQRRVGQPAWDHSRWKQCSGDPEGHVCESLVGVPFSRCFGPETDAVLVRMDFDSLKDAQTGLGIRVLSSSWTRAPISSPPSPASPTYVQRHHNFTTYAYSPCLCSSTSTSPAANAPPAARAPPG
jgi:hypothetical protein